MDKRTFTANGPTPPHVTNFHFTIDEDGDALITANDVPLFYIDADDSKIHRMYTNKQEQGKTGLTFTVNNQIAVAGIEEEEEDK